MNEENISIYYNKITELIDQNRLREALTLLKEFLCDPADFEFHRQCEEIELSYHYMLEFFLKGAQDEHRKNVYQELCFQTWELADRAYEYKLTPISSKYRNEMRRTLNSTKFLSMETSLERWKNAYDVLTHKEMVNANPTLAETTRSSREEATQTIFRRIWTSYKLTSAEYEQIREALEDTNILKNDKCIVVSSLTLALLDSFDLRKVQLLLKVTQMEESLIRQRSYIGLIFAFHLYKNRLNRQPNIVTQMKILSEDERFVKEIQRTHRQYIRCMETVKITQMMNEEILPEMMKHFSKGHTHTDEEGDDFNPEWEMSERMNDKLMKMSSLQLEGADVYLSTFSQLKGFGFFREISNWFYPFDQENTYVHQTLNVQSMKHGSIAEVLLGAGHICNSDKYSFCFTLASVPMAQKEMMMNKIMGEAEGLELERTEQSKLRRIEDEEISNQYIQDLYRFYALHPRRKDFYNIFSHNIYFEPDSLLPMLTTTEHLVTIFEYHVRKKFYKEAINLFGLICLLTPDGIDAKTYQEAGYCCQKTKDFRGACVNYHKADLMRPDNLWTLKNLALCYRNLMKWDEALSYYQQAENIDPTDIATLLGEGYCLAENGDYERALQYFFRIDLQKEGDLKVWRAIGWYSLACGKLEQSLRYLKKVIEKENNWQDYLNLGHAYLCTKQITEAIQEYNKAAKSCKDRDVLLQQIREDRFVLFRQGINEEELPLILDLIEG